MKPKIVSVAVYSCQKCGDIQSINQTGKFLQGPLICLNCGYNGFTFEKDKSEFAEGP